MQVKIEVSPENKPPRAVIYTDQLTTEIQRALDVLQAKDAPVLAERNGRTFLLTGQEICMVRVEDGERAFGLCFPEVPARPQKLFGIIGG